MTPLSGSPGSIGLTDEQAEARFKEHRVIGMSFHPADTEWHFEDGTLRFDLDDYPYQWHWTPR